jgi:hypothetical protein
MEETERQLVVNKTEGDEVPPRLGTGTRSSPDAGCQVFAKYSKMIANGQVRPVPLVRPTRVHRVGHICPYMGIFHQSTSGGAPFPRARSSRPQPLPSPHLCCDSQEMMQNFEPPSRDAYKFKAHLLARLPAQMTADLT